MRGASPSIFVSFFSGAHAAYIYGCGGGRRTAPTGERGNVSAERTRRWREANTGHKSAARGRASPTGAAGRQAQRRLQSRRIEPPIAPPPRHKINPYCPAPFRDGWGVPAAPGTGGRKGAGEREGEGKTRGATARPKQPHS